MKDLADMTLDELNALPVYEPFGRDTYPVQPDGTVTLPDGRVLRGLVGAHVHIPRMQDRIKAMFTGPKTPLCWGDEFGNVWMPVLTDDGYKRTRA